MVHVRTVRRLIVNDESDFTIAFDDFDVTLLPEGARVPGSSEFVAAVRDLVAHEYQGRGGWAQIVVDEDRHILRVAWGAGDRRPEPLETAVEQLRRGNYDAAIRTLEVLRFQEPDNPIVLFNLGMALSDTGRLPAAIARLRRAMQLAPENADARTALGVALARAGQVPAAIGEFREAVELAPTNLWAHRNLGGCLLQSGKPVEAERHLRRAVELNPADAPSRLGLGQCLLALDKSEEADGHLTEAVRLDPHGQVGEAAKAERSRLAQNTFRRASPDANRPDAIMYCLGALERFKVMAPDDVQRIGFEIAILGMNGIDPNDPTKKHTLRSLPGEFTGLQLLCLMYVAFKIVAPGRDVGFDVSREYESALSLFDAQKRKGG
jgi:Tfp pilus assembly protein PilF